MSEIKMKNCPFCGEELREDTARDGTKFYFHYGDNGCFLGYVCITGEKSINAWNTRKPMERIVERLEEEIKIQRVARDKTESELDRRFYTFRANTYADSIRIVKEEGGISV